MRWIRKPPIMDESEANVMGRSKLPKGWNGWAVTVAALLVIGILYALIFRPFDLLLPIIIFGGIFLLYKFPPAFLRGGRGGGKYAAAARRTASSAKPKTKSERPRAKTVPFRVIDGGKDDEDAPKYH